MVRAIGGKTKNLVMKTYIAVKHSELAISKAARAYMAESVLNVDGTADELTHYSSEEIKMHIEYLEEYYPKDLKKAVINELKALIFTLNTNKIEIVVL